MIYTFRYNKYKHELIDLCLINSVYINQRWSITYHSIISFIKEWRILTVYYYLLITIL